MKKLLLLFSMFLFCAGFSQDSTGLSGVSQDRTKLSLDYIRKNNIQLSKEDSLSFEFENGDTLVTISHKKFSDVRSNKTRVLYEPRNREFLKIYEQVVFGTPDKWEHATLKIWKEPLRLYFDPSVPGEHQQALLEFAKKISSDVDSLRILKVSELNEANYVIFYRQNERGFDFEPRINNNREAGYFVNWNGKQQLTRGVLKVNTNKVPGPKDQLDLLKFYFFKSLGYFHASPEIPCEGYLSVCPVKRKLTKEDLEILKYHYSYGMAKGVDIKTFRKIHKEYEELTEKFPDSKHYIIHED